MSCLSNFNRSLFTFLLVAGMQTMTGLAQVRSSLSDAEVQANVLRSLAAANDRANQSIETNTNAGVVTLSGSVRDETQRTRVDQVVATTAGVRRVIDQLTVANENSQLQPSMSSQPTAIAGGILQSDGTYTTAADAGLDPARQLAQAQQGASDLSNTRSAEVPPPNGPSTDAYGRPLSGQQTAVTGEYVQPPTGTGHPGSQPAYGPPPNSLGAAYGQGRPYDGQPYARAYSQNAGQPGGQLVTLPSGTTLRVRINQHLSSREVVVGTLFDGMVVNDVVAGGQVAIPRGTFLQGSVVDAEAAGHLTGRGELGLKLTQITLGGKNYPIGSDVFTAYGGDKTIQSVNSAVGLGALGAIFGAVAGGGVGAAVGAGAGGALGLGASAASGRRDAFIPPEVILTFRLTQPLDVTTVSQAEMQRLAAGVSSEGSHPQGFARYHYTYDGPVLYPRYYRPYGYYPY